MTAPKPDGGQDHRDRWRNALFQDDQLGPSPRLVASVLKEYTKRRAQTVWLTLNQLERETSTHRTTVQRAIKLLRERGWLTEIQPAGGHRAAVYELTIPEGFTKPSGSAALPQSSSTALPLADPEVAIKAPGVAIDPPRGGTALPNQEIKRSIPPTPRSIAAGLLDLDDDDELLEHLDELLEDAQRRMGPIRSVKGFLTSKRDELRHELELLRDQLRPAPLQLINTANDPQYDGPTVSPDFIAAMRAQRKRPTEPPAFVVDLADKLSI